jgi:chromosome segregation ATPase
MRYLVLQPLVVAAALAILATQADAQVERTGGGSSQKIMQQYQQLAAEKTALQTQVEALKKDLDTAHSETASLKKERDALKAVASRGSAAEAAQAKSSREAADRAAEQSRQRMAELVTRFRELGQNLKDVESERTVLRADLNQRNQAFDTCAEDNLGLYETTMQVLDRYERTGMFTKVSASEPFTKITRTRIENLVDEYRERAQQLRVQKRAHDATPPPSRPAESK